MAKKTLRKGAGVKIGVTFLLSIVVGYTLTGVLRFITEKKALNGLLLDVSGTIRYLLNDADPQSQLLVAILSVVFFGWFLSKMRLFEHKYEDAHDFGVHGSARFTQPHEVIDGKHFSKQNKYSKANPEKTLA